MTKSTQRFASFSFGIVFFIAVTSLAILFPKPTEFQYLAFRIVLSLAAAGVAAMLPGFIKVTISNWLSAGGALAVFVVIYFYNPASLVATPPDWVSINIPAGTSFEQATHMIAKSQAMKVKWISCTNELKQKPVEPGEISAKDGLLLIEAAASTLSDTRLIKSVTQDDKGAIYEIRCN